MADLTRIVDGFYKGIPIRIDVSGVAGGRKKAIKGFPNRDTQTVQDFGLRPRSYALRIVVAPLTSISDGSTSTQRDYFEYRDQLLAAFEERDGGTLIHPLYGRVDNVVAVDFTLEENLGVFGEAVVNVTLEVNNDTGIPRATATTLSQLAQLNSRVISAVSASVSSNFAVTNAFGGNFEDAMAKVEAIIAAASEAIEFVGEASDGINEFNSFLGRMSGDVSKLVAAPNALALSITNLFSGLNGLFGTAEATSRVFASLFSFGDDDHESVQPTTASRVERRANRLALNNAINVLALGYAYVAAADLQFESTREIEGAADALEAQFKFVSGSSGELEVEGAESTQALTDLRVTTQALFDEQRASAKQVVSIDVRELPARIVAYQYYGDSTEADSIIALNEIDDPTFVSGSLEVLTA